MIIQLQSGSTVVGVGGGGGEGGTNLCSLKDGRRSLFLHGYVIYRPYMVYIGMCRCEGYGFQAVYSRIGYRNQNIWV